MLVRSALLALVLLVVAAPAHAAFGPVGTLNQLPGADGCVDDSGTAPCADVRGMLPSLRVAASPDGSAIVVPGGFDTAAVLRADPVTGVLSQPASIAGCVSAPEIAAGCRTARNLDGAVAAAFSPDGRHVYVAGSHGLAAFDHVADAEVGGLVPLPGAAACYSDDGTAQPGNEAGACRAGRALSNLSAVQVTPDGAFVIAVADPAGVSDDGVVILARDRTTGALTQADGAQGCVTVARTATGDDAPASGCGGELRAASNPSDLALSADGIFLATDEGVISLRRDAANLWHQPTSPDACVVTAAQPACTDGRALRDPFSLALSPDGASLYVSNASYPEIAHLRVSGGALSQAADASGCAADGGAPTDGPGPCTPARAIGGALPGIGVSPDGRSVVAGGSETVREVAVFDRDDSGAVTQPADARGCISKTGEASGSAGGPGKCMPAAGIGGSAFVWSPGGHRFYASGVSSVAYLRREVAPACDQPSATTDALTPVTLTFACSDLNGDAVTLELTRPPQRGAITTSGTSVTYTPDGTGGVHDFGVRPMDSSGNLGRAVTGTVTAVARVVEPPRLTGKVPLPRPLTRTLKRDRRGRMHFSLACPASAPVACKGTVAIRTTKVRTSRRGRRRVVPVLSRAYDIAPGRTARLSFRPSSAIRRVLRARRLTGLTVTLSAPAQGGLVADRAISRAQLKR